MDILTRMIYKPIAHILNAFGKGSDFPGREALKMDKDLLKKFQNPPIVIAVTGSSGKSSTAYMIYKILKDNNYKVQMNLKGSNLTAGITSVYLKACNIFGKTKLDALVLEVDERYTEEVFKSIKPTHIVLTNITRDQPPRQGNYRKIYNTLKNAITDDATLIINADDPIITSLSENFNNKKIFFGCCRTKYSTDNTNSNCLDMLYCEKCHHKLKYNYVHTGCTGDYYCSNCDFKRKELDYAITNIENNVLTINENYQVKSTHSMPYYYFDLLNAFAVTSLLGVNENEIVKSLNDIEVVNKRADNIEYNGRKCEILNGKNENAPSYNQLVNYVKEDNNTKTIVFGFEYISMRYKYQDISWLYDIDFELLTNVDKIICVGDWANDIAARFNVAGFDKEQIMVCKDFTNLKECLDNSNGTIYALLNMGTEVPFKENIK